MRLLDRYITREVASHAILGLAVFTFVFFVPQLVRLMDLIVRHSGGTWTVAKLFLCSLPPVLTFTLPMAVLVGVLIGLGRLSADSEIVALHACGISLRRLLLPVGFVAAASALITLVMTFWLSPVAIRTLRSLEDQLRSSQAPFAVQPRVFDERFPHFVLYVQDVEAAATHWRGVFLAASGGQTGSTITIAEDATIVQGDSSPGNAEVELHLGPGSTHEFDPREPARYNVTTFGESAIPIDVTGSPGATAGPKRAAISNAELPVLALLRARGAAWRDARVELHRRIAFPAACLVFALLGIPVGVRPRRGGRATGLILTLILIGGYYFLFVTGAHMAQQGSISPWLGIWIANIVALVIGLYLLRLIETVRKPNPLIAWFEARWSRFRKKQRLESEAAPMPPSNGRLLDGSIPNGPIKKAMVTAEGPIARMQKVAGIRRLAGAGTAAGFPMMIDFYLLQGFFYYFGVLLAGFVLIFDAFTLFDMLSDISRNHIPISMVLEFFRYLVPYFLYQLAPLATLVATLVTLAILAKNNEVIAFKASGISLYRLILPLTLAGGLIAGGMFLLDDTILPYANQRQDALRNQIKGRPAQTYFQPARQWIMGEGNKIYNYELFDPDNQLFGGLNVFEIDPATFQIRRRVFAARATWEPSESTWALAGGWVRDFNDGRVTRYAPFKVSSLAELTEPPSYFRREVRQSYQMNWRQLGSYIESLQKAGFDTARLSVQWQKKFAFPLIAAIIVFLGAPFAFLVGTRGAIGGLALAVGVGIVYWATAALFEALGSAGQLPPVLAAWAPDAIFGFLAVYFFLKMPT
ncbi:MAG TPA: LPS export ABC transporter permease LptF [Candidatus Dormibacteraeota bacterium]|nr:LPS export ABC transporter permease LptF [Candidatus Dormibacteraeota bacterium]